MYFEPTHFEEYVSKLAQGSCKPPVELWRHIERQLNEKNASRLRLTLIVYSAAATLALIVSLGAYFSFSNLAESSPAAQNFASVLPTNTASGNIPNISPSNLIVYNKQPKPLTQGTHLNESENVSGNRGVELRPVERRTPASLTLPNGSQNRVKSIPSNQYANPENLVKPASQINNKNKADWSFSSSVSPNYTHLSVNDDITQTQTNGKWQLAGEVMVRKQVNKWFSVQTGLAFVPVSISTSNIYLIYSNQSDKMLETIRAKSPYGHIGLNSPYYAITNYKNYLNIVDIPEKNFQHSRASINQKLFYLEIPVVLSFSASKLGYNNINAKIGFSTGILLGNRFSVASSLGTISGKAEISDKISYNLQSSLEYSYPIDNKISLFFEPTFKYCIKEIEGTSGRGRPISFHLKVGIGIM